MVPSQALVMPVMPPVPPLRAEASVAKSAITVWAIAEPPAKANPAMRDETNFRAECFCFIVILELGVKEHRPGQNPAAKA